MLIQARVISFPDFHLECTGDYAQTRYMHPDIRHDREIPDAFAHPEFSARVVFGSGTRARVPEELDTLGRGRAPALSTARRP
jgi:hypothetical protein